MDGESWSPTLPHFRPHFQGAHLFLARARLLAVEKKKGDHHFPEVAMRYALTLLLCLLLAACASDGKEFFKQEGCFDCHSFQGHGGRMGPDLTAVGERLSAWQMHAYVRNPADQNPKARMPARPDVPELHLWSIILYLRQ
jgi:hypothetical protein